VIAEVKIYEFDPRHEEDMIEPVLSSIIPLVKSLSFLPHTLKGCIIKCQKKALAEEEYYLRRSQIGKIDWSELRGSDGQDERFCQGETCEIPLRGIN
jgi:hypothetical protein